MSAADSTSVISRSCYAPRDHGLALGWLHEVAQFDTTEATDQLHAIVRLLGADPRFLG